MNRFSLHTYIYFQTQKIIEQINETILEINIYYNDYCTITIYYRSNKNSMLIKPRNQISCLIQKLHMLGQFKERATKKFMLLPFQYSFK